MAKGNQPFQYTITLRSLLILLVVNALILFGFNWQNIASRLTLSPSSTQFQTPTLSPSAYQEITYTPIPSPSATHTPVPFIINSQNHPLNQGSILLAINTNGFSHLFSYKTDGTPFSQLFDNPWDERAPSLSPDGKYLAFSSKRNGYWDIYILNLENQEIVAVTDTGAYDSNPTWSPDSMWLAYESYQDGNFDIWIKSIQDLSQPAIRLTYENSVEHSPTWSSQGRIIAFVSNQTGMDEIWLADLDNTIERFSQVSKNDSTPASHPRWSPDGLLLAWSVAENGVHNLYTWDSRIPEEEPRLIGTGSWPVWSPGGELLLTIIETPNSSYLTGYQLNSHSIVLPAIELTGTVYGFDWGGTTQKKLHTILNSPNNSPTPFWQPLQKPLGDGPANRKKIVPLENVKAPHPFLHDDVDDSFFALQQRLNREIGWDYLSSLENAFVPITSALQPGMGESWLYTGRGIVVNSAPISANWLVVTREEFGYDTYWRVYLKTRYQDGSQGEPLSQRAWDFNSRSNGDPRAYEAGGKYTQNIPEGYWIDFTNLALQFGWNRLPALPNWLSFYPASRFNHFVFPSQTGWRTAMLELYPPEALVTPTVYLSPTPSQTATHWWYKNPTYTYTPTASATPTRRPTWTPIPGTLEP